MDKIEIEGEYRCHSRASRFYPKTILTNDKKVDLRGADFRGWTMTSFLVIMKQVWNRIISCGYQKKIKVTIKIEENDI